MAGLGAKLFTAFSKLTAAQVNGYLMDQSIMRFASTAARDAAFGGAGEPTLAEGMFCYLDDTNVLQSYTGSAWVSVASSSGAVLQVVQGTTTTQTAVSSATYISSTLTVNITPKHSTSKILITSSLNGFTPSGTEVLGCRIVRTVSAADTVILTNTNALQSGAGNLRSMIAQQFLDSPATTSTVTYKIEIARTTGAGTHYAQLSNEPSVIIVQEISA